MRMFCALFSFSATSTSEMYTLSLHDALPIFNEGLDALGPAPTKRRAYTLGKLAEAYCQSGDVDRACDLGADAFTLADRKSTRLNSSHTVISYAVFCLKKKKEMMDRIGVVFPV